VTKILYTQKGNFRSLDIFRKLLLLTFNGKISNNNIFHLEAKKFNIKNLPLLLAWPSILQIELAILAGDKKSEKELNYIIKLLDKPAEISKIKKHIYELIETKTADKFLSTINLLFHPESMNRNFHINLIALVYNIANYNIFCLMLTNYCEKRPTDSFLTFEEIKYILQNCGLPKDPAIHSISLWWIDILVNLLDEDLILFSKAGEKGKLNLFFADQFYYPSIKLFFKELYNGNRNNFAFIWKYKNLQEFLEPNVMGKNISLDCDFRYDLWYLQLPRKKQDIFPEGYAFLFEDKNGKSDNQFFNLIFWLNRMATLSASAMYSFIESWEDFFDNPKKNIGSDIKSFKNLVESILDEKNLRERFFQTKKYSRMVGDIDTEIDHEDIEEVRDLYKEAKFYHIPIKLKQKLLDADKEIKLFVRQVLSKIKMGKERLGDSEKLSKYLVKLKNEYHYLKLLNHHQIKRIILGTTRNDERNNQRNILPIINKKLGGKDFLGGSTLTKLLGLESGDQAYLRWRN